MLTSELMFRCSGGFGCVFASYEVTHDLCASLTNIRKQNNHFVVKIVSGQPRG